MDEETRGKLDKLLEEQAKGQKQTDEAKKRAAQERAATGARLEEIIETVIKPMLASFAVYLGPKGMSAELKDERPLSILFDLGTRGSLRIIGRVEEESFDLFQTVRGSSEPATVTVLGVDLTPKWLEDQIVQFIDAAIHGHWQ